MPAGGYQAPNNPATFSGPGKFAQRTDGGVMDNKTQGAPRITGQAYGENKDLNAIQSAQPLASSNVEVPSIPALTPQMLQDMHSQSGITPLNAGTQRPEEPLTAGMPFGDGTNQFPNITPLIPDTNTQSPDMVADTIRATYAKYPSPGLYSLIQKLDREGR